MIGSIASSVDELRAEHAAYRRNAAFAAVLAHRAVARAERERVLALRAALDAGLSTRALGRMLGVSASFVSRESRREIA